LLIGVQQVPLHCSLDRGIPLPPSRGPASPLIQTKTLITCLFVVAFTRDKPPRTAHILFDAVHLSLPLSSRAFVKGFMPTAMTLCDPPDPLPNDDGIISPIFPVQDFCGKPTCRIWPLLPVNCRASGPPFDLHSLFPPLDGPRGPADVAYVERFLFLPETGLI